MCYDGPMRMHTSIVLASAFIAVSLHADTLSSIISSLSDAPHAAHVPAFSAARESFTFASDGKAQEFWTIKDGDRYVAILQEGAAQLDMITFDPTKTVEKPPFQAYYSWGTLLGTRILTTAWVGDMRPTGKVEYKFSEGGKTLVLDTVQTWPGRKGSCRYHMTLRVDPVVGYVWDCHTEYDTDKPPMRKAKRDGAEVEVPDRVEFFNWQVRVTGWTKRHNNPRWPAAWTHERTVFQRKDGAFVGFYNNPDAVDRSRFKRTDVMEGGFVAMGPDADGRAIALAPALRHGKPQKGRGPRNGRSPSTRPAPRAHPRSGQAAVRDKVLPHPAEQRLSCHPLCSDADCSVLGKISSPLTECCLACIFRPDF